MTKILVIEDEQPVRETLVQLLELHDFEVLTAPDGQMGVQIARHDIPDLILCDVQMPGIDGYEVLKMLRSQPQTATIPFIFLTSLSARADFRLGMELGADDYLTKPFTADEFFRAIEVRLSQRTIITQPFKQALQQAEARLDSLLNSTPSTFESNAQALEAQMRWGLVQGQFLVYYQPQMDVQTGQVTGAEALVRWQHPERGILSPAEFIPLAEETGLIIPIGDLVLQTACAQAQHWIKMGFPSFRISVNLSPRQFSNPQLSERILQILEMTGLNPANLQLEVTESCLIQDVDVAIATIRHLSHLGVKIAIDDFGTGYASLSYLKQFAFNTLKIDRCFVHNITEDAQNAAITTALIQLAHALNLTVVAEGVETQAELVFLKQQRCDAIQGYWLSRPLSILEFEQKFIDNLPPYELVSSSNSRIYT